MGERGEVWDSIELDERGLQMEMSAVTIVILYAVILIVVLFLCSCLFKGRG